MRVFKTVKEIHDERERQRGNKIIYTLLGVMIGELDRLPTRSEPTEDQIYTIVNRMYNNALEMRTHSEDSIIESLYLQDFIKKQLTEAELVEIIMQYKEDGLKNIGDYMRALNEEYKGRFDGKKASAIIKQLM